MDRKINHKPVRCGGVYNNNTLKLVEKQASISIFSSCVYTLCLQHSAIFEIVFTMTVCIYALYFVRVDG